MNKQAERFEEIRKRFSNPEKAIVNPGKIPGEEGYAIGLSIPIKNKKLEGVIRKLKKISPEHRFPSKGELHITVAGIKILPIKFDSSIVEEYSLIARDILNDFTPLKIKIKGLNHFPNVIFAQVFSLDGKLFELHNKLFKTLPSISPEFSGENYIPHIAVVPQFKIIPEKLFKAIEKYKDEDFGEFVVDKIELAKWKYPPRGEREIMETFSLNN